MPQFDTFSFLSQLFWVFLVFCFFYTALSYYLLPAIAITLKIRNKKLTTSLSSSSDSIVKSDDFTTNFSSTSFDSVLSNDKAALFITDRLKKTRNSFEFFVINKLVLKTFKMKLVSKTISILLQR